MPITQRLILNTQDAYLDHESRERVNEENDATYKPVKKNPITADTEGEGIISDVTFSSSLGCLQQLAQLVAYSREMFDELGTLTTSMSGRINNLTVRVDAVAQGLDRVNVKKEQMLHVTDNEAEEALMPMMTRQMIQKPQSHDLVNKENMPMSIMRAYDDPRVARMLPLHVLDDYKCYLTNGDKIDTVSRCYSNPDFFLRQWVTREKKRLDELSKERKQQRADKKARKQKQKKEEEKVGEQKMRKKSSINWHDRYMVDGKAVNRKSSKTDSRRNSGWSRGVRKASLSSMLDGVAEEDEERETTDSSVRETFTDLGAAQIQGLGTDAPITPKSKYDSLAHSVASTRSAAPSLTKIFSSADASIPAHPSAPSVEEPKPVPNHRASVTGAPVPPPPPPPPARRSSAPVESMAKPLPPSTKPPPPAPRNSLPNGEATKPSPPAPPPPPPKAPASKPIEEGSAAVPSTPLPAPATAMQTPSTVVTDIHSASNDSEAHDSDEDATVLKVPADSRRDSVMSDLTEMTFQSPSEPAAGGEVEAERRGTTVAPSTVPRPHYLDEVDSTAILSTPKMRPPPPPPPPGPRTPGGQVLLKKPAPPPPRKLVQTSDGDSPSTDGQVDISPLSNTSGGSRVNFSSNQHGSMLDAIRRGSTLKKVNVEAEKKRRESIGSASSGSPGGGLNALAKSESVSAILERRKYLEGDSSDSDEDSDANDDDWD